MKERWHFFDWSESACVLSYLEDVVVIGLVDDDEGGDRSSEVGSIGDELIDLDICAIGHCI